MPNLVLFHFEGCPYCIRVRNYLAGRNIKVALRDTQRDPAAREELLSKTGRTQVPCLFIDGEPLFESADIIQWFEKNCV